MPKTSMQEYLEQEAKKANGLKDDAKKLLDQYAEQNIVKATCKELGLTYKELGERIGYGDGAIKNAASSNKISEQLKKAIEMLIEIETLKSENKKFSEFKALIKEFSKGE